MRSCPSLPAILIGHVLLAAGGPVGAQVVPRTVGDVTRDGKITAADALAVLVHVVGKSLPEGFSVDPDGDAACLAELQPELNNLQAQHMLVRSNGPITAVDALVILRHVVGYSPNPRTCIGYQPEADLTVAWRSDTDTVGPVGHRLILRAEVRTGNSHRDPGPYPWGGWNPDTLVMQGLMRVTVADPAILNVDTLWLFPLAPIVPGRGHTVGTTVVTARWFDKSATQAIHVVPWTPSRIMISLAQVPLPDGTVVPNQLVRGTETAATVTAYDALNTTRPLDPDSITWASGDDSVVAVNGAGQVTAMGPGTTWVAATWRSLADTVTLTVISDLDATLAVIGNGFRLWFSGNYGFYSAGLAVSNMGFQHTAPWGNAGMDLYGRIPRIAFLNTPSDSHFRHFAEPWRTAYRALDALGRAYRELEQNGAGAELSAAELNRARAFIRFSQGMHHAQVAVLYDRGPTLDDTTPSAGPTNLLGYMDLMAAAFGYFDQAAALSEGAEWSLPYGWMQATVTGPMLARVARSMKARYRASVARSPAERAAVNWAAVTADVDAGITEDFVIRMDYNAGWDNAVLFYGTETGWSQMPYFIYGMADQAGRYQAWNQAAMADKSHTLLDGEVLIVTPDNRFPQGTTVATQRLAPGRYFRVNSASESGNTWVRPDRGTWRWSWYKHTRGHEYRSGAVIDQAEIRLSEMRLLKAEAAFRMGNWALAAALVNETRVAAGLNATDPTGVNSSCVPKLPAGHCGDLFEMLKWEKRLENTFQGPFGNIWYFDARGWGDLWKGTFLHLPIPCDEATKHGLPCLTYGGSGDGAAALSTYKWNGEG